MTTEPTTNGESVQTRPPKQWQLRLYVAGKTPKSVTAFANLERICEEHLAGEFEIEVIDLIENPRLAKDDQIVAIPTLVRKLPPPIRKIIGDLSDTERTLVGLQLRPSMKRKGGMVKNFESRINRSGDNRELEKQMVHRSMEFYDLRLYIAGLTPRSTLAVERIRSICESHLSGRYE